MSWERKGDVKEKRWEGKVEGKRDGGSVKSERGKDKARKSKREIHKDKGKEMGIIIHWDGAKKGI